MGVLLEVYDNLIGDQFITPIINLIPFGHAFALNDLPYMFLLMTGIALIRKPGAAAALILLMSTKPSEVIWAFYKFRMPAAIGLAFVAALRFLPQMIERMSTLLQVMQVRGYDLTIPHWWQVHKWPGYIARVFKCIPIVTVPLLISSLRSTSVMAMVADARAFGSRPQRTMLIEHQITPADRIAAAILLALILAVTLILFLHIGNRQV